MTDLNQKDNGLAGRFYVYERDSGMIADTGRFVEYLGDGYYLIDSDKVEGVSNAVSLILSLSLNCLLRTKQRNLLSQRKSLACPHRVVRFDC